jgi:dTMP kinase
MIHMLKERLTNLNLLFYITRQPTDIVRKSEMFRTFVDTPNHDSFDFRALSLFTASDRLQHCQKVVLPALENQNIVISDRYYYSCLANHRAKGYAEDQWIYEIASYIPEPDFSFFLDVNAETSIQRTRQRESEKNRWIDVNLQYKLREEYINISKSCRGILVNTEKDPHIAFDQIWNYIQPKIHQRIHNAGGTINE